MDEDAYWEVRWTPSSPAQPSLSKEARDLLLVDPDPLVRQAMLKRPDLPDGLFEEILHHSTNEQDKEAVLSNPHLPEALQVEVAADWSSASLLARRLAERDTLCTEAQELILQHPMGAQWLASSPACAEQIQAILPQSAWRFLAYNPALSDQMQEAMLQDLSPDNAPILGRVLHNPGLRAHHAQRVVNHCLTGGDHHRTLTTIARHPSLPVEAVLAAYSHGGYLQEAAVENPNLPVDLQREALQDPSHRYALANNPGAAEDVHLQLCADTSLRAPLSEATPHLVVQEILAKHPLSYMALGRNPRTPLHLLEKILDRIEEIGPVSNLVIQHDTYRYSMRTPIRNIPGGRLPHLLNTACDAAGLPGEVPTALALAPGWGGTIGSLLEAVGLTMR